MSADASVHSSTYSSNKLMATQPIPIQPPQQTTYQTTTTTTTTTVDRDTLPSQSVQEATFVTNTMLVPSMQSEVKTTPTELVVNKWVPDEYTSTNVVTTTYPGAVDNTSRSAVGAEYNLPQDAYQESVRKVSSVVVDCQPFDPSVDYTAMRVTYVDVPTYEEQISYVNVSERREVVVVKPIEHVTWNTKTVHKPKTIYKDTYVDVINKEYRDIPVRVEKIVDVPVYEDTVIKVPTPVPVEKKRNVPGPLVEIEKPYEVRVPHEVFRYTDREVPVVVAQTLRPIICGSERQISVEAFDYEPVVQPVDVHVAKPVASSLENMGAVETKHRLVNITSGQYNTILKLLNQNKDERTKSTLPYITENGRAPFTPDQDAKFIVAPYDTQIEGWTTTVRVTAAGQPAESLTAHVTQNETRDVGSVAGGVPSVVDEQVLPATRGYMCCNMGARTATQKPMEPQQMTARSFAGSQHSQQQQMSQQMSQQHVAGTEQPQPMMMPQQYQVPQSSQVMMQSSSAGPVMQSSSAGGMMQTSGGQQMQQQITTEPMQHRGVVGGSQASYHEQQSGRVQQDMADIASYATETKPASIKVHRRGVCC